jgi:glutamine amidotransferase
VPTTKPAIAILDLGSGDFSALTAVLEAVGVSVSHGVDRDSLMNADGLVVLGEGSVSDAMVRLRELRGDEIIERRLSGGRPVWGIGNGMHILFDSIEQGGVTTNGLGQWPGIVREGSVAGVPEWVAVDTPADSVLFARVAHERFLVDSAMAATAWTLEVYGAFQPPRVTWATHTNRFVAAVENGPLSATQFHPERSGDAGARLLRNWLNTL